MVVGILVLDLRLAGCRSLKDKRQVLRSLLDKTRREFKVAIAEVGDQDLWGNALLCASCPSNAVDHVESVLFNVEKLFENHPDIEVASSIRDLWRP